LPGRAGTGTSTGSAFGVRVLPADGTVLAVDGTWDAGAERAAQQVPALALQVQATATDPEGLGGVGVVRGGLLASASVLLVVGAVLLRRRRRLRHVQEIIEVAEGLADGQTSRRADLSASSDSLRRMAAAVNRAADNTQMLLAGIACHASTVHEVVTRLSRHSAEVSRHTAETAQEAMMLSLATDEVTSGVQELLDGAEELRRTLDTIAARAEEAGGIAAQATAAASGTSRTVATLGEAGSEISDVAAFIGGVAGQTNLLALNATIEAVRAGAAGKGFEVVAEEVKQLATKTREASGSIDARINAILGGTAEATTALGGIESIIAEIVSCQDGIGTAVDTQRVATEQMSQRVERTSDNALRVTESITSLATSASNSTSSTRELATALAQLLDVATNLHELTADYEDLELPLLEPGPVAGAVPTTPGAAAPAPTADSAPAAASGAPAAGSAPAPAPAAPASGPAAPTAAVELF
ncbi:methyl-accepting chemotaxis protein, partial [Kineococcus glutinatus]|uniref:methyl-accepting chemotaxis protein n=1 Tax=Kineococcus glutinatus TaxID=1070872 RepID=UPI0031EDB3EB